MAITARVGTWKGNPKVLVKDGSETYGSVFWASETLNLTVSAYEEIDDLTCDFILNGHGYHSYNYMEVDWGGTTKYYFIEKRSGMTGDMTKVRCTCDVLYTYSAEILNASAIINRTSWTTDTITDFMLRDNKVTTTSRTIISSEALQENVIGDQEWYYVGVVQKLASTGYSG